MSEEKIASLNRYAAKCKIIASAKVYESDKEVSESIKKIGKGGTKTATESMYVFAVKESAV